MSKTTVEPRYGPSPIGRALVEAMRLERTREYLKEVERDLYPERVAKPMMQSRFPKRAGEDTVEL